MKKIPKGISDFEKIIKEDYIYVDKTKYIEEVDKNRICNTNMVLNFLNYYIETGKIPEICIDENIESDSENIKEMFCRLKNEHYNWVEKIISGEEVATSLTLLYMPQMGFDYRNCISLLYYMGLLTFNGKREFAGTIYKIPNNWIKQILFGK